MLYIYRTKTLPNNVSAIYDVDGAYDALNPMLLEHLHVDNGVKEIIKEIDGSRYENNVLHTVFGETSINNCSSGCKTAILVYLYSLKEFVNKYGACYINVSEVGDNAMHVITRMSVDKDIYIHCNRIIPLYTECGDIIFEGKKTTVEQMIGVDYNG